MSGSYRFLPHTADLRLEAEGGSPDEAITAALSGLVFALFVVDEKPDVTRWVTWRAETDRLQLAVVELLAEALFIANRGTEIAVAYRGGPFAGELGLAFRETSWIMDREIKAVTYNEPVSESSGVSGWRLAVTLDL